MALLQFVQTHKDAILPKKNLENPYTGDAGLDIFSVERAVVPANGSLVVEVGLKLAFVTPGYWFRIEGRSGLGFVKGIQPHFGIIDNSYRGSLGIKLYNLTDKEVVIEKGKGIAQAIVYEMIPTTVQFVDEVTPGERGEAGFGSTGM